jgi:tetratricopeptide (TPR) repeat protein
MTLRESSLVVSSSWTFATTRMHRTARVLQFRTPTTASRELSPGEISLASREFLEAASCDRDWQDLLNVDILLSVIGLLWKQVNFTPEKTVNDCLEIHEWIKNSGEKVGVFDERDFFLGDTALIAAGAFRLMGQFDSSDLWLDVADAAYRHTINPAPLTAKVQFQRLALRYDLRKYAAVKELAPGLKESFDRLGMRLEANRTAFLEATAIKEGGDSDAAFARFQALRESLPSNEGGVLASTLVEIGAHFGRKGDYEQAVAAFQEAESHLSDSAEPVRMAHLKASIGEAYRAKGELNVAVDAFRLAIRGYLEIGMQAMAAYLRVVAAETLIAANRQREAEWELLAAMPVIEEQKLVAEGLAAVALLRESLSRKNVDGRALCVVRDHLSNLA